MSDTEKNADDIIEEAMKDIYGGIKDPSDTDAGAGGHGIYGF